MNDEYVIVVYATDSEGTEYCIGVVAPFDNLNPGFTVEEIRNKVKNCTRVSTLRVQDASDYLARWS